VYLATPLTDGLTTPLITDQLGNALAVVHTTGFAGDYLSLTFDSNPYLTHDQVLAYGLVNWVTKGLFLGERHVYLAAQVDDVFIEDREWLPGTACTTNPDDPSLPSYRINAADLQAVINWQAAQQSQPTTPGFSLSLAFNGVGTDPSYCQGTAPPTCGANGQDDLTPAAQANQGLFNWINHTFDHTNLDSVDYNTAFNAFSQNNAVAAALPCNSPTGICLGLTNYSLTNLVQPDLSGWTNGNALQAAYDTGIRYVLGDTSKAPFNSLGPNVGIYSTLTNPDTPPNAILGIPRHPVNLFFNVTTPDEWSAEYNCIYGPNGTHPYFDHNLSYNEILDFVGGQLLPYLLTGDIDPWMFHEDNLRNYPDSGGIPTGQLLLGDLLDATLTKYNSLFDLPILSLTQDNIGQRVARRMAYNQAGVTATIVPGQSITISAQLSATVPVTGLNTPGAETYGGQPITYLNLSAGQSITLPLH